MKTFAPSALAALAALLPLAAFAQADCDAPRPPFVKSSPADGMYGLWYGRWSDGQCVFMAVVKGESKVSRYWGQYRGMAPSSDSYDAEFGANEIKYRQGNLHAVCRYRPAADELACDNSGYLHGGGRTFEIPMKRVADPAQLR